MSVTKDEALSMTVSSFDQLQAELLDWSRKNPDGARFLAAFLLKMQNAEPQAENEDHLYAFAALGMMSVNAARLRADIADETVAEAVPIVAPVVFGQGEYAKAYTPRIPSRRWSEWPSLVAWLAVLVLSLVALWGASDE